MEHHPAEPALTESPSHPQQRSNPNSADEPLLADALEPIHGWHTFFTFALPACCDAVATSLLNIGLFYTCVLELAFARFSAFASSPLDLSVFCTSDSCLRGCVVPDTI